MSQETSKSRQYRILYGDFEKYLNGYGIDIGGGPDPLSVNGKVDVWDLAQGDAMTLQGVSNNRYDFVYSSHCLEHLDSIDTSICNWSRVLKTNGVMYITLPDFELYEKSQWPSKFAGCPQYGHKYSFSLNVKRNKVGRSNHFNIKDDFLPVLRKNGIEALEVRLELEKYNFLLSENIDQTTTNALIQICIIGKKI